MSARYDLAVIGSGFAGSLIALIARRLGLSVLLIEKGRHPRVVIGESSTPLSNLLLEELACRYDLPRLKPLAKWGSWQQTYPQLACGLKRGFSFFDHTLDDARPASPITERRLLVAASPHDAIADTHWYRADVDAWLVGEARALGVEYIDELCLEQPQREANGWLLKGTRKSETRSLRAAFLLDATGPRGFLHQAFSLGEAALPGYPDTSALYSHFSGVAEFPQDNPDAPYPVDAAALHHVFDGGWIWMLRFNNGITSAGVAAARHTSERFGLASKEEAWQRVLQALPAVREQFRSAKAVRPFAFLGRLSFLSSSLTGERWALMPSAAGFLDPLLSTGFPLSLLGISRLAQLLEHEWNTPRFDEGLRAYGEQTQQDLLATARLIGALYRSMADFPTFRAISLLYFAAASYAETARRLGKPWLADSFLLHKHPHFGPGSRRLLERTARPMSAEQKHIFEEDVYRLIEPFDVAGLCIKPENHCYPVRAEDLLSAGRKLGATSSELHRLLERSGFYAGAVENA